MDPKNHATAAPRHRGRHVLIAAALAVLLLILLWDWNWFRPLVERQVSSALGRPVTLRRFDVDDFGRRPLIRADGITLANPPEFPEGSQLGSIERLALRLDLWSLIDGPLHLLLVGVDRPVGELRPGPSGKVNYLFEGLQKSRQDEPARQAAEDDAGGVQIGRLSIRDGEIHIVEPRLKADFRLKIRTLEPEGADAEPRIRIDAEGSYADAPIQGRFIGGSVLSLREPSRPYPVDLKAKNGDTQVSLQGTVLDPLHLGGADLKLDFRGNDLADLFPLTGVPLPPSPAYHIAGRFDYADGRFRFRDAKGSFGQSDIAGDVTVDPAGAARRHITIVAQSDKVVWQDLAGLIGATPGDPQAKNETPEQRAEREKKAASGRLLPQMPISLPRIRAADLDVQYKIARIETDLAPVDSLEGHLVTDSGFIRLKPLRLGLGQGSILANIALDGRSEPVHTVADVDFRRLDLKQILQKLSAFEGFGTVGGSAWLDARGNSLAEMLAAGNGELKLFMTQGDISGLLLHLAGLDFGNALIAALGLPRKATLRCMVADLGLQGGALDTRTLLVDTTEANLLGEGSVDLAKEQIDYRIRTQPKRANAGRVLAPIEIKGPLRDPGIFPDKSQLAARGGVAALLGAVIGPLAALIPTLQLGLGEDNDCVALIREAQRPASPDAAAR